MNNADWVQATGSAYAGRGGFRPINPKLLALAKPKDNSAIDRRLRKLSLQLARASMPLAPPAPPRRKAPARYPARTLSDCAYWYGSNAERIASDSVKHLFHGPR
jgi:hypothetical protein